MTHNTQEAAAAIRAVFERGAAAWNRGDLAGYLATYADGETVRWVSGNQIVRGKRALAAALEPRFTMGAAMGQLQLHDLQIEIQTAADALVFGAYRLTFEAGQPAATGVFTVHLKRFESGWAMVSDHASSLEG